MTSGVILVAEDFCAGLIQLVCHTAVFIVVPSCRVRTAISEGRELIRRVIGEAKDFVIGVGFKQHAARAVAGVSRDVTQGVAVVGQATGIVGERFDTSFIAIG